MAMNKRTSLEASFASLMVFLMFSLLVKSFLVVLSDTFSTCAQALSYFILLRHVFHARESGFLRKEASR